MRPCIIIAGPTGSGKTLVAAELALMAGGEIISADSRQVYKYLDAGTNKSGTLDKNGMRVFKGVKQHLTDILEPGEHFSAGSFAEKASEKITSLKNSKLTPIIAGGTGLYIKSLVDGLAPMPEQNPEIRENLAAALKKYGKEHLYKKLKSVDPQAAEKNRGNPQRIIRALEVFLITGIPITELHKNTKPSKEKFVQFGLRWEKAELYPMLDGRCVKMAGSGMIDETKKVLEMGFDGGCPALESLGYNRIVDFLKGSITLDTAIEAFKTDTRHYAKRQMTWFNKDKRVNWIDLNAKNFNPAAIAGRIVKELPNLL